MNVWFLLLAVVLAAVARPRRQARHGTPTLAPRRHRPLGAPSEPRRRRSRAGRDPRAADPETVKKRRLVASAVTGVGAIACVVLAFIA